MIEPILLHRVLTDLLKRHPDAPLSRWLLFEIGVRRGTTNSPPSRIDRLWRALAAAITAAICLATAVGAISLTEGRPSFSTSSYILTGVAVFGFMCGVIAGLSALIELVRAPFSPRRSESLGAP